MGEPMRFFKLGGLALLFSLAACDASTSNDTHRPASGERTFVRLSAAEDGSLTTKAMEDQPGTMGGSTSMPNAKASDGNLTTKAMQDQPGTMGGSTSNPTAKSDGGSLTEKAMKDQPGTK